MKHVFACLLITVFAVGSAVFDGVGLDTTCAQEPGPSNSLSLVVETLSTTDDPAVQQALLRGILAGLAGRRQVAPPPGWDVVQQRLLDSGDPDIRELTQQLAQIFGDPLATGRALSTVLDGAADPVERRRALASLVSQQHQPVTRYLESLLQDPAMRIEAIRSYASLETATAPAVLLDHYSHFDDDQRRAVVETLATRKRYARALADAIAAGTVARDEIPAHVARSLSILLEDEFHQVFGEVRSLSEDRAKLIAKYKSLCSPEAIAEADAARGRAVFEKTCASCHLLYGVGGKIGPDLTGSNRANLDYILLNSVDPSYDVPEGYKMVLIQTVDGRLFNGVVAEEDEQRVVLKTVEQPEVVIPKSDIGARKVSTQSMMPEGQLEQLTPQQVVDLIKYLRSTEQVEMTR